MFNVSNFLSLSEQNKYRKLFLQPRLEWYLTCLGWQLLIFITPFLGVTYPKKSNYLGNTSTTPVIHYVTPNFIGGGNVEHKEAMDHNMKYICEC